MTSTDAARIHERIDATNQSVVRLTATVSELKLVVVQSIALHAPCSAIVMGNGQPGMDKRVTRLETYQKVKATIIAGGLVAAGVLGAFAHAAIDFFKK